MRILIMRKIYQEKLLIIFRTLFCLIVFFKSETYFKFEFEFKFLKKEFC